jgi:hypothetical protein
MMILESLVQQPTIPTKMRELEWNPSSAYSQDGESVSPKVTRLQVAVGVRVSYLDGKAVLPFHGQLV